MSRLTAIALSVAAAAVMTGCNRQAAAPQAAAERPVPVTVEVVGEHQVNVSEELSGRTVAYRVAEVRPQVNGVLLKRLFTEGSSVKEGQSLYQIDASTYEASVSSAKATLAQAEANLALARADAQRSSELVKANAVSKQSDDTVQARVKTADAALKAARAAVQNAEINLQYTAVRAPISGRVSISEVTPGALMTAYQPQRMTVIHQLDPIYVDVQQTNAQLLQLRRDIDSGRLKAQPDGSAKIRVKLEDGTVYPAEGKLTFQGVSVNETTGTVTLRAVFPNPKGILMPGMYVRAELPSGDIPNAITVNQHAVMRDQRGDPYVFVVNAENRVEMRPLKITNSVGDKWVIDSGLKAGEKVVLEGIGKVRPGALVAAQTEEEVKAAAEARAAGAQGAPAQGAPAQAPASPEAASPAASGKAA